MLSSEGTSGVPTLPLKVRDRGPCPAGIIPLDGFHLEQREEGSRVSGRFQGREFGLELAGGRARYSGPGFSVTFDPERPAETAAGSARGEVDLTYYRVMALLADAIFAQRDTNYVNTRTTR